MPTWLMPVPRRSGRALRQEARRVLAEPQFKHPPGLVKRIWDWLSSHLGLPGWHLPGYSASLAVVVALVAVLAVLAVAVLRRAARARAGGGAWSRRHRAGSGVVVTEAGVTLSPEAWLSQAAALEAEGRWREALRCRYRALVGRLAQYHVVEEVPGRTAGDYQRLVGAQAPQLAPQFSLATAVFEGAWYGEREPDEHLRQSFCQAYDSIISSLGHSRAGTAR